MIDLVWLELHPPRNLTVEQLTAALRPLATRPRLGFTGRTPVVVFEAWSHAGSVRWLLGVERLLLGTVPQQLQAQMPGLAITGCDDRPADPLAVAVDLRLTSVANPLRRDTAEAVSAGVLHTLGRLQTDELVVLQWVLGPAHSRKRQPEVFNISSALGFTTATPSTTLNQPWREKASEPLFAVCARAGVTAGPERTTVLLRSLIGTISAVNAAHAEVRSSVASARRARALHEVVRKTGARWAGIVNTEELATLLAFPLGEVVVPGRGPIAGRPPRKLLRSLDEMNKEPIERVIGRSLHPADHCKLVTMPENTVRHNVQVIGPTGSGKSTELANLILADASAGRGVVVIEPRGDLVADVLARLPKHRHNDIVVIDPSDSDQVGINPLAGPIEDAERRADELAGLFRAEFGSAIGPRSADVLLHTLLTAARLDDGTLADVPVLLSNSSFRRTVLAKVSDPLVLGPWWAGYDAKSVAEQQQISAPITNKLRAFLSRTPIRRLLGVGNPRFSFDAMFTDGPKVVLINLNRGVIGPEAARLLGSLLLASIWQAMQRRAKLPRDKRFAVELVVDEFQDYVGGLDFGEVTSQIRGLGGSLTLAHQHMGQLTQELRAALTANCRSRLAFRPSHDDAKPLAAMMSGAVTADDLEALGAFQLCAQLLVDSATAPPFAVQSLPLPAKSASVEVLRRRSRAAYATDGKALDDALLQRWHGTDGDTIAGGIGTRKRKRS